MPAKKKPPGTRQDNRTDRGLVVVEISDEGRSVPELPLADPRVEASNLWASFWSSDLSQVVEMDTDVNLVGRWIRYVDQWYRAMDEFEARPMTAGSQGQTRANPIFKVIEALERFIKDAESNLGLNPLARSKLGIAIGQGELTAQEVNARIRRSSDGAADQDQDDEELGEWVEAEIVEEG